MYTELKLMSFTGGKRECGNMWRNYGEEGERGKKSQILWEIGNMSREKLTSSSTAREKEEKPS